MFLILFLFLGSPSTNQIELLAVFPSMFEKQGDLILFLKALEFSRPGFESPICRMKHLNSLYFKPLFYKTGGFIRIK